MVAGFQEIHGSPSDRWQATFDALLSIKKMVTRNNHQMEYQIPEVNYSHPAEY